MFRENTNAQIPTLRATSIQLAGNSIGLTALDYREAWNGASLKRKL